MNTATTPAADSGIREKIALAVSGAILVTSAIYWIKQIGDALEMLKLAHGG